jgi:hypothetical protein
MLELPHAVVGATIAVLIPEPAISLPLALASHFIMDLYPHWNPHIGQELKRFGKITSPTMAILWADSTSALIICLAFAKLLLPDYSRAAILLLCCFLSVLPDVIEIPIFIFHKKWAFLKKLARIFSKLQSRLPVPAGIYTQIIVLIVCFILIFKNL